jgi:FG-GAP-like repeat
MLGSRRYLNKRSCLGLIGAIALSSVLALHAKDPIALDPVVFERAIVTGMSIPTVSVSQAASKPIAHEQYSVDFARQNLVPAIGGSIVTAELGKKGHPDLYVVIPGGSNHLLRNNQNGTFSDVTEKAGVKGTGSDLAAAFADYDHSGRLSLFVAGLGGIHIYHANADGTFSDVTNKSGITNKPTEIDSYIVLFDADGDGFTDLLVAAYTDLATPPTKPSFVFPNNFPDAKSRLYRNQHDGTFKDVTEESGLASNPGRTRKVIAADFNGDGSIDLLFLRDNKPPALFMNMGKGKFEDKTSQADEDLIIYAFLDGQAVDLMGTGKPDLALWSSMANRILFNQGDGKFEETKMPVITQPAHAFGFHGLVADLNGDGLPDLLAADATGKWRLLIHHEGNFVEAPFVLSSVEHLMPDQFAFITSAILEPGGRPSLLTLTKDGQLQIFEEKLNTPGHPQPQSPRS